MANFLCAYKLLDGREGGYSNDPLDAGGETYRGIARNYWPAWAGWLKLDLLKSHPEFPDVAEINPDLRSAAGVFYKGRFWDALHLDDYTSQDLANYLFDTAVNFGFGSDDKPRTSHWLQESLNEMGAGLTVDGKIGPSTLSAVKALTSPRLGSNYIVYAMEHRRIRHRYEKIKGDGGQKQFITGWLARDLRTP